MTIPLLIGSDQPESSTRHRTLFFPSPLRQDYMTIAGLTLILASGAVFFLSSSAEDTVNYLYGPRGDAFSAGRITSALLWSVSLWYASPLQLASVFIGRFDQTRPSDRLRRALYALVTRSPESLSSTDSVSDSVTGSTDESEYFFGSPSNGELPSPSTTTSSNTSNNNITAVSAPPPRRSVDVSDLEPSNLSPSTSGTSGTSTTARCSPTNVVVTQRPLPLWTGLITAVVCGAVGTVIATSVSVGLQDDTWAVASGLGASLNAAVYELGRRKPIAADDMKAMEDYAKWALINLERSGSSSCHESEVARALWQTSGGLAVRLLGEEVRLMGRGSPGGLTASGKEALRRAMRLYDGNLRRSSQGYYKGVRVARKERK